METKTIQINPVQRPKFSFAAPSQSDFSALLAMLLQNPQEPEDLAKPEELVQSEVKIVTPHPIDTQEKPGAETDQATGMWAGDVKEPEPPEENINLLPVVFRPKLELNTMGLGLSRQLHNQALDQQGVAVKLRSAVSNYIKPSKQYPDFSASQENITPKPGQKVNPEFVKLGKEQGQEIAGSSQRVLPGTDLPGGEPQQAPVIPETLEKLQNPKPNPKPRAEGLREQTVIREKGDETNQGFDRLGWPKQEVHQDLPLVQLELSATKNPITGHHEDATPIVSPEASSLHYRGKTPPREQNAWPTDFKRQPPQGQTPFTTVSSTWKPNDEPIPQPAMQVPMKRDSKLIQVNPQKELVRDAPAAQAASAHLNQEEMLGNWSDGDLPFERTTIHEGEKDNLSHPQWENSQPQVEQEAVDSPPTWAVGRRAFPHKATDLSVVKPEASSHAPSNKPTIDPPENPSNKDNSTQVTIPETEPLLAPTQLNIPSGSNLPHESVPVPLTKLDQIPTYLLQKMEMGGNRQIIFRLDPPELGKVIVRVQESEQHGLVARVLVDADISQQHVDALMARFAELNRPGVHVQVETVAQMAATGAESKKDAGTGEKRERQRQQRTRDRREAFKTERVYYG